MSLFEIKTYELEDMLEQIDAFKYNQSMFITGNKLSTNKT